jgi:putative resolvase
MYVSSKKAQQFYNVSGETLRLWAEENKIKFFSTKGGHRRYFIEDKLIEKHINEPEFERKSIIYARVSSTKQKDNLQTQIDFLKEKYPKHEIMSDIGSGINFKRKDFKTLLEQVLERNIKQIVVAHKDRLTRFGFELFKIVCDKCNTRIIIVNDDEDKSPSEELSEDLMSIITVFSARYYGTRKYSILQKNTDIS